MGSNYLNTIFCTIILDVLFFVRYEITHTEELNYDNKLLVSTEGLSQVQYVHCRYFWH